MTFRPKSPKMSKLGRRVWQGIYETDPISSCHVPTEVSVRPSSAALSFIVRINVKRFTLNELAMVFIFMCIYMLFIYVHVLCLFTIIMAFNHNNHSWQHKNAFKRKTPNLFTLKQESKIQQQQHPSSSQNVESLFFYSQDKICNVKSFFYKCLTKLFFIKMEINRLNINLNNSTNKR